MLMFCTRCNRGKFDIAQKSVPAGASVSSAAKLQRHLVINFSGRKLPTVGSLKLLNREEDLQRTVTQQISFHIFAKKFWEKKFFVQFCFEIIKAVRKLVGRKPDFSFRTVQHEVFYSLIA